MRRRSCLTPPLLLAIGSFLLGAIGHAGTDEPSGPTASRSPTPIGLEELMGHLARSGGVRARFRETKHLSLLTAPLVTEGTLYFAPPDLLARHTTRPGNSSVVVHGDRVAFRDETGHQIVELGSSEIARHFADNLRVLLRGDLTALRSRYTVGFEARGQRWSLRLEPRARVVRRIVESIRVEGQGAELVAIERRETSGDRTAINFHDVETGLDFAPSELDQIFSLEDPDGAP